MTRPPPRQEATGSAPVEPAPPTVGLGPAPPTVGLEPAPPAVELEPAPLGATPAPFRGWTARSVGAMVVVLAILLGCFGWLLGAFDFHAFLAAAHAVRTGASPYGSIHSVVFETGHAFVYPYAVAWAFVPLTFVPTAVAVGLNLVTSVAAIVAGCHLLGRRGFAAAALVLVSSTTIIGLQMGTLNAFLFFGLALAWSQRRRVAVVGTAVGLVAVSKLFLVPMIVWLVAARRYRAAAVAVTVFLAALFGGLVLGPVGVHGYLRLLTSLAGNESLRSWSLSSFVQSLGAGVNVTHVLVVVAVAAVLATGYAGLRRSGDERIMFAATVVACLLASPIVWSSYLVLAAVPLLVVAANNRSLAVAALVSWALVTPDLANPWRIGVGVALVAVVATVAVRSDLARLWAGKAGAPLRLVTSGRDHEPIARQKPSPMLPRGDDADGLRLRTAVLRTPYLAAVSLLALGAVFAFVPSAGRNALPALVCVGAAGAEAFRAVRATAYRGSS